MKKKDTAKTKDKEPKKEKKTKHPKLVTDLDLFTSKEKKSVLWEIIKTIFTVALVFVFIRYFIIQPFLVVGSSMEPNFHDNEYIFVNELTYRITGPKRGDVVVFKHPTPECSNHINTSFINKIFLQGPCRNFIKRIVGLPGERVKIENGEITIINSKNPEGLVLNETDYIPSNIKLFGNQTVELKKGEYYVLGDNRQPNGSSDSREWGALPKSHITGKAWLKALPLNDAGFIKRPMY